MKEQRALTGQSAVLVKRERHRQSIVNVLIVTVDFIKVQMIMLARLVLLGELVLLVNLSKQLQLHRLPSIDRVTTVEVASIKYPVPQ